MNQLLKYVTVFFITFSIVKQAESNVHNSISPLQLKITSVIDRDLNANLIKVEGTCFPEKSVSIYVNSQFITKTSCTDKKFSVDKIQNINHKSILKITQLNDKGSMESHEIPIDGILKSKVNVNVNGFISRIDSQTKIKDLNSATLNINSTSTASQIQNEIYLKLENARAGTRIIWPAGQYNKLGDLRLFRTVNKSYICSQGEPQKPIIIEAIEPDKVIFNGYVKFTLCGKYVVLRGFKFTGNSETPSSFINLGHGAFGACEFCAIRQMHFDNLNQVNAVSGSALTYVSVGNGSLSRNNEITDSRFEKKSGMGVIIYVDPDIDLANTEPTVRIARNYFHRSYASTLNGFEILRFGNSSSSHLNGKVILEHNLFENTTSEVETVSIKSSKNIIRFNTFYQVTGTVTNRIGSSNIFEGNYFLGNNIANMGALRLTGANHLIVANHIEGIRGGESTVSPVQSIVFHNADSDLKGSSRTTNTQDKPYVCDYTNYCPIINNLLFGNYLINNNSYIVANINTSAAASGFNEDNDNSALPSKINVQYNIFNATNGKSIFTNPGTYNWAGFDQLENNWINGNLGAAMNINSISFLSNQKLNIKIDERRRFSLPDSASRAQLNFDESKANEVGLTSGQRKSLVSYGKNLYQLTFPLISTDVGLYLSPYP